MKKDGLKGGCVAQFPTKPGSENGLVSQYSMESDSDGDGWSSEERLELYFGSDEDRPEKARREALEREFLASTNAIRPTRPANRKPEYEGPFVDRVRLEPVKAASRIQPESPKTRSTLALIDIEDDGEKKVDPKVESDTDTSYRAMGAGGRLAGLAGELAGESVSRDTPELLSEETRNFHFFVTTNYPGVQTRIKVLDFIAQCPDAGDGRGVTIHRDVIQSLAYALLDKVHELEALRKSMAIATSEAVK